MIERKANELIRKYKTNNPFELVKNCNIKLLYADLGNIGGFYQYYKRSKLIIINESLSALQQKEICAHELGHALLHPKQNRFFLHQNTFQNNDKLEREANLFAAYLLISEEEAAEFFQRRATVSQISAIVGISPQLAEERMCRFVQKNNFMKQPSGLY